jgi:glycosyltransferase involved in cell wall biosynthesis
MQLLSAEVYGALQASEWRVTAITLGRSQWHLVWWLPLAALRVAVLVGTHRVDHVIAGDAMTFLVAKLAAKAGRPLVSTIVCGLDVTWPSALYQAALRRLLPRATMVIAISSATAAEAVARGVTPSRVVVLKPGLSGPQEGSVAREAARRKLLSDLGAPSGAVLILTLGRLVRRKGVAWFVKEVIGRLPADCIYLVAGEGPERRTIEKAIAQAGAQERVHLYGRVSDEERERLLTGSDIFVQPNVHVPGDMEGFGLVLVEAALRGTPVIAAAIEGIMDAVIDQETGFLVPSGNSNAFVRAIISLCDDDDFRRRTGERFRERAEDAYSTRQLREGLKDALNRASVAQ